MLPIETHVTARIGAVSVSPVVTPIPDKTGRDYLKKHYIVSDDGVIPPLYMAKAWVDLVTGSNQIIFEYDQPLAAREIGYGYFSDGRMLPEFRYMLWPLKEWRRAKGFAIDVRIEVGRQPPSWWRRTFGHPVAVACDQVVASQKQEGAELVYRARLGDSFPDTLYCRIGEDDLL